MRLVRVWCVVLVSAVWGTGSWACGLEFVLPPLAENFLSGNDPDGVSEALLNDQGQEGLDAVLAAARTGDRIDRPEIREKIDRLAGQRDAWASGLYWHRDFEEAKARAQAMGRPILSLRLLGRLDQDLSCANSRFFRTALYANQALATYLKDRFVLHWESVRPVPVMTIDFGDGRTMKRTITGNSFHYVLDTRGRMVDVLPGLYGPTAFRGHLERAETFALEQTGVEESARYLEALRGFHQSALAQMDLVESSLLGPATVEVANTHKQPTAAAAADRLTVGKSDIEAPALQALLPRTTRDLADTDPAWDQIAAHYAQDNKLDASGRGLFMAKENTAERVNRLTESKKFVEDPAFAALRRFEVSLARDTAFNEHRLHRRLHDHVVARGAIGDLEVVTRYVYAELSLPLSTTCGTGSIPPTLTPPSTDAANA